MKAYKRWTDAQIEAELKYIKDELTKCGPAVFWGIPTVDCPYTDDLVTLRMGGIPSMVLVPTWMTFTFKQIKAKLEASR